MKLDAAIFYTHSIEAIVPFYRDVIGLELEDMQGDMYASFVLDGGGRLGIKRATDSREIVGAQTVILQVDDIQSIHDNLVEANIQFYEPLTKASWGTTFSILDPDKNKVEFVQR